MINSTSNSKEFGVYIGYIMNRFSNDFLTSVNMRDWDSYVILNTCIYNNHSVLFYK